MKYKLHGIVTVLNLFKHSNLFTHEDKKRKKKHFKLVPRKCLAMYITRVDPEKKERKRKGKNTA